MKPRNPLRNQDLAICYTGSRVQTQKGNHPMLRVRLVHVPNNGHSSRFDKAAKVHRKVQVGQEVMVYCTSEAEAKATRRVMAKAAADDGATWTFLAGEERIYLRTRPKAIGLWRESEGFWIYALKLAQVGEAKGLTATERQAYFTPREPVWAFAETLP